MEKVKLLIDTDVLIDYLNTGLLGTILEDKAFEIYYSIVTKKELLSKRGLKDSERQAILLTLKRYRLIPVDDRIAGVYSDLRRTHPSLEKEDALVAATALTRRLQIVTRNWKHYRDITGLALFTGSKA